MRQYEAVRFGSKVHTELTPNELSVVPHGDSIYRALSIVMFPCHAHTIGMFATRGIDRISPGRISNLHSRV